MKKSSLAVAALLSALSAATVVPAAYADSSTDTTQQAPACKGACAGCKGSSCKAAPCAGSTCGGCSGS